MKKGDTFCMDMIFFFKKANFTIVAIHNQITQENNSAKMQEIGQNYSQRSQNKKKRNNKKYP